MVTSEAEGRLAEIASEEAADAAVPGADPGDDAITAAKLLLQLLNMRVHLRLIDHPVTRVGTSNPIVTGPLGSRAAMLASLDRDR